MAPGRWVRIDDIWASDLSPDVKLALTTRALHELGIAQALVLIHGERRGLKRYIEAGGAVRPDEDGQPVIWSGT